MARSNKDARGGHNGKGAGYEYWSRRSYRHRSAEQPGRYGKRMTHRLERRHGKCELRALISDEFA